MKNNKPKKVSKAQLRVVDALQAGTGYLWTDKAGRAYLATSDGSAVRSAFVNGWTFKGLKTSGVIELDKKTGRWHLASPQS